MPLQQISVSPLDWGKENSNSGAQPPDWRLQEPVYTPSTQTLPQERCASQASTLSNNHDICRICHCEGDSEVPLIAPCYCSGSLRYVHQACLQQWIKSSDIRSCELCKFQFIMQSKIKPFSEWEKLDMSAVERRKLLCSVTFHVVALTCVVWSLYVLIDRTAEEIQRGILEWPFWTKLIVVAIGFTGGLVFMYIQCKMYMQLCRRWKAFNRVIFVQNAPEKAPPPKELLMEPEPKPNHGNVLSCCAEVEVNMNLEDKKTDRSDSIADSGNEQIIASERNVPAGEISETSSLLGEVETSSERVAAIGLHSQRTQDCVSVADVTPSCLSDPGEVPQSVKSRRQSAQSLPGRSWSNSPWPSPLPDHDVVVRDRREIAGRIQSGTRASLGSQSPLLSQESSNLNTN